MYFTFAVGGYSWKFRQTSFCFEDLWQYFRCISPTLYLAQKQTQNSGLEGTDAVFRTMTLMEECHKDDNTIPKKGVSRINRL